MIANRIVGLIGPSYWFGIGCVLLLVGGMLWWIREDLEPTAQRTLWKPYPACRIVGWSFLTFFILIALFGLPYAPPPPPSLRGVSLHMATLLVSGTLALFSVVWWVMGWLLAHLVIVPHNLLFRFVVTQDLDPREMLWAVRREMDPEEIVERMLRRFHGDPDLIIHHYARALPPPQRAVAEPHSHPLRAAHQS
jgi:hypothetical protein